MQSYEAVARGAGISIAELRVIIRDDQFPLFIDRQILKANCGNYTQLARRWRVSNNFIADLRDGTCKATCLDEAYHVSRALGMSIDELLEDHLLAA